MLNYIPKITEAVSYKLLSKPNPEDLNIVETKTSIVLDILLAGEAITAREAALSCEIFCLPQIISRLRHNQKIPVKTKIYRIVNQSGKSTIYGEYYLTASDIADVLKKEFQQ